MIIAIHDPKHLLEVAEQLRLLHSKAVIYSTQVIEDRRDDDKKHHAQQEFVKYAIDESQAVYALLEQLVNYYEFFWGERDND